MKIVKYLEESGFLIKRVSKKKRKKKTKEQKRLSLTMLLDILGFITKSISK